MLANKFIVASFVSNEGTKKESRKYFVAKVLKIISKNEIKIDCLRPFKEYNHKFIQGVPEKKDESITPLFIRGF
jgi:hypothetical protein